VIWLLAIFVVALVLNPHKRTLLFVLFGLVYFGVMDTAYFDANTGQRHTVYSCAHPEVTPNPDILAASGEVWYGGKICHKDLTHCQGCDDFEPANNVKEIPSRVPR